MNNIFSSDLCTLSTLTESTILCTLGDRYKDESTESYVGSVLLSLGSSSKVAGPQFVPSFASSVLRSLAFSCQDQSVLINGYHTSEKNKLANSLLSNLMALLEYQPTMSSVTVASELIDHLSCCEADNGLKAVVTKTLIVHPYSLGLKGAHFSCLLLDTSNLAGFEVMHQKKSDVFMESSLRSLGMSPPLIEQVLLLVRTIRSLVTGAELSKALIDLGVSHFPEHLSENYIAQLLYAYLIRWIICWLNSNCFIVPDSGDMCWLSLICSPGNSVPPESQPEGLSSLLTRYADEVLHNIYCTRLFVWEQEQYMKEGIEWDLVEVEFNQSLINTFHQDGGLLEILGFSSEEEIRSGVERCCQFSGDSCFIVGNHGEHFALAHFTGECEYDLDCRWLHANRVHVASVELQSLLLSSSCSVLVDIAQNMSLSPDVLPPNASEMDCRKLTERAKLAMDAVSDVITTSQPHFVFSLKLSKDSNRKFNHEFILNQLQQFKILDIALIQSCGYPIRLKYFDFLKNYGSLLVDGDLQSLSEQEKCASILQGANIKEWCLGASMVMLKPWHLSQLDMAMDVFHQSAKKLQRAFRRSIAKKKLALLPDAFSSTISECSPPTPPPRPTHTLPQDAPLPPSRVSVDYDKASANLPESPHTLQHNKFSWKRNSSTNPAPQSSQLTDLHAYMWFQGKLSRAKAEECLKEIQFDCFLIRESENRIGEYALSMRHGAGVKHFRIDTKQDRYSLYGAKRSFPSVEALVDYYNHHCISSAGELLSVPYSAEKSTAPVAIKRKLSSIRRPKPSLEAVKVVEPKMSRADTAPDFIEDANVDSNVRRRMDLSNDSMIKIKKKLEVEERIVEAARRIAEIPTGNRKERQKRKQSLQEAQSRLLSLRQQYHTLQERIRFIEISMQNNGFSS